MSGNAGIQPPRSGEASTNNRLDSWKEIAAYIKRDVRTVQRWEKQGGLPVHRLQHDAQATIYAYRTEIDAWWHSRQHEQFEAGVASATIRGHRFSPHWWFLTAALLAAISITFLSVQLLSRRSRGASDTIPRLLTANPLGNRVVSAAISPDGKYLAYTDDNGILLKHIDSGEIHPLASTSGLYVQNWFPDGSRLLASRYRDPSLWIISILNGTAHKLQDDAGTGAASPDGLHVAFLRNISSEIWVTEGNGDNSKKLVSAGPGDIFLDLCWSPTGQRFAYIRAHRGREGDQFAIESRDLKGDQPTVIVSDPRLEVGGATGIFWLPDGRLIYTRQNLSSNQLDNNLWAIRTDIRSGRASGEPRQITGLSGFLLLYLSASVNGKRLAFLRAREQFGVYLGGLGQNGKDLRKPKRLTLDNWNNLPNAWTSDSQAVLFESDRNGRWEIFKQRIDGSTPEGIVSGGGDYHGGSLSSDGSWLLFWAGPSRKSIRLMRMPIAGGLPIEVLLGVGSASHRCSVFHPSMCILSEQVDSQLVFSAFDPVEGRGAVKKRMEIETPAIDWSLSPDGTRIAVVDLRRIRILDLGTGITQTLAIKTKINEMHSIAWSRDGRGLFLSASHEMGSVLFHVDMQGHLTQLIQHSGWIGYLQPSPDGKYLAFAETSQDINAAMIEKF